MKDGEKYFAFISYSRKDSEIARGICRRLESFRYPSSVERQYRPKGSRYVKEIFLDRTKLECSQECFHDGIRNALALSRYLIVVCSENSAVPNKDGKHWVNDEIAFFLSCHGGDDRLVVPVLKDGRVGNLPPIINTESMRARNNPVCLRESGGVDLAVAQVLSYFFRLPTDILLARLNSQRLRFFRRMAVAGLVLALVFSIMGAGLFVLKARADKNRRLADENAYEAKMQAEKAVANARETARQAEIARQNAKEADRERKLATQSLEFMVDTFRMSDPLNAGQSNLRMVDVLKARIPDIDKLEPWELRAEVGCQVGSLLYNVGLFDDATNLLFKTVSLNQSMRPNSTETAYSMYCASWCFMDMLDIASALEYAQKALSIYEAAGTEECDPMKIALVCNAIGVFSMNSEKDVHQARGFLTRSLDIRQRELGLSHVDVAVIWCNLGYLYSKEGHYEQSVSAYERALEIYRVNGKESHVGAAKAWRGIGLVCFHTQEYKKAIDALEKALAIQIKAVGRNSTRVSNLYREIALAYRNLGDYPKALTSMKTAYEIAKIVAEKTKDAGAIRAVTDLGEHVRSIENRLRGRR